jgi:hypothetical protein
MGERHSIYLKREAGKPKPWTNDPIMRLYFFTNPYREHDKTTKWFRENVREQMRNDPAVLMATVIFRWFNLISTGEVLLKEKLLGHWNQQHAARVLHRIQDAEKKVFTGAYLIQSRKGSKIDVVCERIENVWLQRKKIRKEWKRGMSMKELHARLMEFEGLAGFMAYEIVCDLRYTFWLEDAPDIMTWCNPGPGATCGMNRILGRPLKAKVEDWSEQTQALLATARRRLRGMPPLEMREIEHSLCEWDKYERARLGEGHLKRRYQGV